MLKKDLNISRENDTKSLIRNIADCIKKYRTEQNLSVKELSKLSNVSEKYINRIENCEVENIPLTKLIKISDAFKVSLREFFKGF